MRRLFVGLFLAITVIPFHAVLAQRALSTPIPHMVRVLLRPEAAVSLRSVYTSLRASDPDIQHITWSDTNRIISALMLPHSIHAISLKPYLPEHSVVFEDIREHINPSLFLKQETSAGIKQPAVDPLLRTSEERLSRWFLLRYDDSLTPEMAAKRCAKSNAIEVAEPVYPAVPQFTPNDPMLDQQYALGLMNAFQAWDVVRADSSIVIADVDEGVALSHPDLSQAIWHNAGEMGLDAQNRSKINNHIDDDSDGFVDDWQGWDYAGPDDIHADNNPTATAPHGTHTSGIAAASGNNNIGIAGVAFGARIMVLKTSADNDPNEKIYYGYPAIVYAVDHGAQAINCSFAQSYRSAADQDVINYAFGKGSVVVAACGNYGDFANYYPASYDHVLSVSMVDANRTISNSPSRNEHVDVAAPGDGILSTVLNGAYGSMTGTSMACPQLTGAVALVFQSSRKGPLAAQYPNMTAGQAIAQVRSTTSAISSDPNPGFNGTGIVDLYKAVTDLNARSLRIESVSVDNGSDGVLHPGEQAFVQIDLKNYLAPLRYATATVHFLDSNGFEYSADTGIIRSAVKSIAIGSFETLEERKTDGAAFPIIVDPTAPAGSKVIVKLDISDSGSGYRYTDYDYFELDIAPPFRDLDTNNVVVSLYNNGAIGHVRPGEANGLGWTGAPKSIDVGNRDLLWTGSFLIGTDASHVADANGLTGAFGLEAMASMPFKKITTAFGQEVITAFSYTDQVSGNEVDVYETGEEFDDTRYKDGLVLDFNLRLPQALDQAFPVSAGLYMDWDLGSGGFNNTENIDLTDSIFYIHRADARYPVVAMKLISPLGLGSDLNYYAQDADTESVSTAADEWRLLTTSRPSTGYCDAMMTLGAKNITFDPTHTTQHLTYAIGMGLSFDSARTALNAVTQVWKAQNAVRQGASATLTCQLWPDPAFDMLHVFAPNFPVAAPVAIRIIDALGRTVVSGEIPNGSECNIVALANGVYWIEMSVHGEHVSATFLKQ